MFACVVVSGIERSSYSKLVDFASQFSPLQEETSDDSVILDLRGSELLNGPVSSFHAKAEEMAGKHGFRARVVVSANPDAAFHAAHGLGKSAFIEPGNEAGRLRDLPLQCLSSKISGIPAERLKDIVSTLQTWGIYSFGQLAALPEGGISERLGPEGAVLRRLAAGKSNRSIVVRREEAVYSRSIDLEHPVALKEPLLFLFSRILRELCHSLKSGNLAASGLRIQMKLSDKSVHQRELEFPFPIQDIKTLQKIVDLELSISPPRAPVTGLHIAAQPGRIRAVQSGLFHPGGPEPEKMELVLARIGKMVPPEKIGSPEVEDSYRPDAFRMRRFRPADLQRKGQANPKWQYEARMQPTLRALRPAMHASIWFFQNRPARLHASDGGIRAGISGTVVSAAGPWKKSGDWWSENIFRREEWDLRLADGTCCRIYRDLQSDLWFVDSIYD